MKLIHALIGGILILFCMTTSCEKEFVVLELIEIPDTISFSEHVMPIFDESCNMKGCHTTGAEPPDLTRENAHFELTITGLVDVDNPESSVLYKRMVETIKPMPPDNVLPEAKRQIILQWIAQGALDN